MGNVVDKLGKDTIGEIKRFLAFTLRHKPFFYKIKLDQEGFADLKFVTKAFNKNKKKDITPEQVLEICKHHSGGIFKMNSEKTKVKAREGHSVVFNMSTPEGFIEVSEVPGELFCAVHHDDIKHMSKLKGLILANKQILLSKELPAGRKNCSIIKIDSKKAHRKKVKFYRNNNDYFSRFVPLDYIKIHV